MQCGPLPQLQDLKRKWRGSNTNIQIKSLTNQSVSFNRGCTMKVLTGSHEMTRIELKTLYTSAISSWGSQTEENWKEEVFLNISNKSYKK